MSSQQVNFFMHPQDLFEFEKLIKERSPVSFIQEPLLNGILEMNEGSIYTPEKEIWLRGYLARPLDTTNIRLYFVERQGYWLVDVVKSPAIELTRSFFDERILRRGRLYYHNGYYNEEKAWITKGNDFIDWAKYLISVIRKNYQKDKLTGYYVGPFANEWVVSTGGKLIAT